MGIHFCNHAVQRNGLFSIQCFTEINRVESMSCLSVCCLQNLEEQLMIHILSIQFEMNSKIIRFIRKFKVNLLTF